MARKQRKQRDKRPRGRDQSRAHPTLPAAPWDMGAAGPANRRGKIIEEVGDIDPKTGKVVNPNRILRARRIDMLDVWRSNGVITERGFQAAQRIRGAYESTMRGPPALPDNDRVQSSPKPDHAIAIQIDRISAYERVMRAVCASDRQIVTACVIEGRLPSAIPRYRWHGYSAGLAHLRDALDRAADALGC